ncbi:Methyl-accepting chemotaxis protein [Pseudomonas syringae pv. cilantro]|nr:Methyl-accepting chemotaxis protein [Pseudomonas syringae pv. cilantro]
MLASSIVDPISASLKLAEDIAAGDLTRQLQITGKDEAWCLMNSLNTLSNNLRDTIQQISGASAQQAHVARDVGRSLISIRNLAAQSSEGTRQTLEASNELAELAVNLNDLVLRFKT